MYQIKRHIYNLSANLDFNDLNATKSKILYKSMNYDFSVVLSYLLDDYGLTLDEITFNDFDSTIMIIKDQLDNSEHYIELSISPAICNKL